jgi:hypothetical protein
MAINERDLEIINVAGRGELSFSLATFFWSCRAGMRGCGKTGESISREKRLLSSLSTPHSRRAKKEVQMDGQQVCRISLLHSDHPNHIVPSSSVFRSTNLGLGH